MDHVVLSRVGRAALIGVALLLVALLLGAASWRGTGGRWMTIETGSMGQAAPVGTLVLTRPATASELHTGDIVSFHTPTGRTFTHRVVRISHGVITTRGDNNGTADPYRTTTADLVGKVVARWWGVGWVLRALPYLMALLALLWLATWRVRRPMRTALRLLGASLIVAGIAVLQHPLVGFDVASSAHAAHGVRASVVSTGILPIEVHAAGGTSAVLRAGQLANVTGAHLDSHARLPLTASAHLTGWWWPAVILVCALPLLIGLRLGLRRQEDA